MYNVKIELYTDGDICHIPDKYERCNGGYTYTVDVHFKDESQAIDYLLDWFHHTIKDIKESRRSDFAECFELYRDEVLNGEYCNYADIGNMELEYKIIESEIIIIDNYIKQF